MKIFKAILASLFSLILIISLYSLLIICNISTFFKTDQMKKNINNINITHEIKKIQNSSATSENKAEIADVINTAYTEAENHGISKKLVDEIFNSSEIKNFLGKAIGGTTDHIINGKATKNVSSEQFNKILDENIDKWVNNSGTKISDSKKEVLLIRMKSASKGIIDNLPTKETVTSKISPKTQNLIKITFSNQTKIALLVSIIISSLIILLVKRKSSLIYMSVSTLLTGILTISTSFIIPDIIGTMLKKYNLSFLINSLASNLAHNILITGITVIIISIILFIINFIVKKRAKTA